MCEGDDELGEGEGHDGGQHGTSDDGGEEARADGDEASIPRCCADELRGFVTHRHRRVETITAGAHRIDRCSGRLTPAGGHEGNHAHTGYPTRRNGDLSDAHARRHRTDP